MEHYVSRITKTKLDVDLLTIFSPMKKIILKKPFKYFYPKKYFLMEAVIRQEKPGQMPTLVAQLMPPVNEFPCSKIFEDQIFLNPACVAMSKFR